MPPEKLLSRLAWKPTWNELPLTFKEYDPLAVFPASRSFLQDVDSLDTFTEWRNKTIIAGVYLVLIGTWILEKISDRNSVRCQSP